MNFKERYKYDPKKDLLGKGGFSEIYRAQDVLLDREVALKFFRADTDERYGILAEIRRVVHFRHLNLVQYYDLHSYETPDFHGTMQSVNVGVMEYVNHGDLYQFIKSRPAENSIRQVIIEILEGLQFIHDNRIIHRDLKPQNILMHFQNNKWTPKIADFGISKSADSQSSASSELLGTVEYMAPEQFNSTRYGIGGKIGTNVDLWSFGVILYELFSGEPYFGKRSREVSTQQIMNNVLKDQSRMKLSQIREPYRSAINLCLVQDANKRVKKAADIISVIKGERSASPFASSFGTAEETSPVDMPKPSGRVPVTDTPPPPIASPNIRKPVIPQYPPKQEFQAAGGAASPEPAIRKPELKKEPGLAWQKAGEPPVKKEPPAIEKPKKESRFSPIVLIVPLLIVIGVGAYFVVNYFNNKGPEQDKGEAAGLQEINNSSADERDFMDAKTSRIIGKIKSYIEKYPTGMHIKEANELLDEISFENASNSNTVEALRTYLSEFSGGKYADEATRLISEIEGKLVKSEGKVIEVPREKTSELSQSTLEVENEQKIPATKPEANEEDMAPKKEESVPSNIFSDSKGRKYTYEGEKMDGLPNGRGVARYSNGDIYEGVFVMGKRHGKGIFTFALNKQTFDGEWDQDFRVKGKATFYPGDEWYDGEWKNSKMTGYGTYHYSNGWEYTGDMINGLKEGTGTFKSENGDNIYKGQWRDDKPHGKVVYESTEGTYSGSYVNGNMEGYGEYTWKSSGRVYKGYWSNGKPNGEGELVDENGNVSKGTWKNGILE